MPLRDELVPPDELDKAKRYLSGGLELRMDETRHVASWIGGQEALHDRVLTLDEALAAIEAVDADDIQRLAGELFRDDGLRLAAVAPARYLRGLERTCGCRPDDALAEDGGVASRGPDLALARLHLRLGSLALARAELETLAGRDALDQDGLVDLAEARWRTGDLAGAGEAAAAALDDEDGPLLALVIAAEAAAARGRPTEARRLADRAMEVADGSIDALFAGMPRAAVWPPDAAAPPPSPTTMFDPPRRSRRWSIAIRGRTRRPRRR